MTQLCHLYCLDDRSLPLLNYYALVFLPQFPVDGWGIASLGAPPISGEVQFPILSNLNQSNKKVKKSCAALFSLVDGGKQMRYMLLVHHDEEAFGKRSQVERRHMLQEPVQLTQRLYASGQHLAGAPLHPTSATTCVRVRDGNCSCPTVRSWRRVNRSVDTSSSMPRISTRRSAALLGFQERGSERLKSGR